MAVDNIVDVNSKSTLTTFLRKKIGSNNRVGYRQAETKTFVVHGFILDHRLTYRKKYIKFCLYKRSHFYENILKRGKEGKITPFG
jgi:hypothetical protein